MRVVIAGSRNIREKSFVFTCIEASGMTISTIGCGMARGVDYLGRLYAIENNIPVEEFPATWNRVSATGVVYVDRLAGLTRNARMASWCEGLIAVWDERSRGTRHMITEATILRRKIVVFGIGGRRLDEYTIL